MKKPLALIILDGFGNNPSDYGNAIHAAKTPNLDKLFETCPHTLIGASGMDVGLPDGQMGNSEVGHTNIGAGRVVYQELTRITKSISDGDFFQNEALCGADGKLQKERQCPAFDGPSCLMAACTATIPICMRCWNWPNGPDWKRCMSTALWMAVTFRRLPARTMSKN